MSILDTVKLGRTPLRVDPRTIQYRTLAPTAWHPPASYDFDAEHGDAFPPRMYLNDTYGDCVIVAQANQITRFEKDEQGVVMTVTDAEVKHEYFMQTGGPDVGLDPISSLNKWRNSGWTAAGRVYNIHAWAQVTAQDKDQTKEAAIVGRGLQVAVRLPISAAYQIDRGEVWDLVAGPDGEAGSWGGHMVYMRGYDADGISVWTWGKVQRATWRWLAAYCDFCALVVDDIDKVAADLDVALLSGILGDIDS